MAGPRREFNEAQSADFANLFESTPLGKLVFETLICRFSRPPVYEGGIDGVRRSDFRAGQRSVVDHVLNQINRSRGVMGADQEPEA